MAHPHPATGSTVRRGGSAKFLHDVWRGLGSQFKSLDSRYLYDDAGCRLFERIMDLPEYYPTRCELEILRDHGKEISARLGPRCTVIAPGCGDGRKLKALIEVLDRPVAVVPIDQEVGVLERCTDTIAGSMGDAALVPVVADFTATFSLPAVPGSERSVVFFGGSTIGNFTRLEAADLLRRFARMAGRGGALLIGVDVPKERSVLEAAYDDGAGVTAAFNRNLLHRINRELDGDFDAEAFSHLARWRPDRQRVEMHLVSNVRQRATVAGRPFEFERWETIHTENAHKYTVASFHALARHAGLQTVKAWSDAGGLYTLHYLVPK